eukprot:8333-Heterococcus_DN1.PRE.2
MLLQEKRAAYAQLKARRDGDYRAEADARYHTVHYMLTYCITPYYAVLCMLIQAMSMLCVSEFHRIAALVEPERSTIGVRESQDANMKRARMQFKKLFSGSFNKVKQTAIIQTQFSHHLYSSTTHTTHAAPQSVKAVVC